MIDKNKISVGQSGNGKGVFARRLFKRGEMIIEFRGEIFNLRDLPSPYDVVEDRYVQIGPEIYIGPSGKKDDLIKSFLQPKFRPYY